MDYWICNNCQRVIPDHKLAVDDDGDAHCPICNSIELEEFDKWDNVDAYTFVGVSPMILTES